MNKAVQILEKLVKFLNCLVKTFQIQQRYIDILI
jgi:hypothetical protein